MADCIESDLSRTKFGYAIKRVACGPNGRKTNTTHHRFVYAEHYGLDLYGLEMAGLDVDHLCFNRGCINIDHLELVSSAENSRRGSRTRLNEVAVRVVRHLAARGIPQVRLAAAYGVSENTISQAVTGKTWAHVS